MSDTWDLPIVVFIGILIVFLIIACRQNDSDLDKRVIVLETKISMLVEQYQKDKTEK